MAWARCGKPSAAADHTGREMRPSSARAPLIAASRRPEPTLLRKKVHSYSEFNGRDGAVVERSLTAFRHRTSLNSLPRTGFPRPESR
jgi:hypothetical protein